MICREGEAEGNDQLNGREHRRDEAGPDSIGLADHSHDPYRFTPLMFSNASNKACVPFRPYPMARRLS
jgi:hypothetical protein